MRTLGVGMFAGSNRAHNGSVNLPQIPERATFSQLRGSVGEENPPEPVQ
jgi:hypothetical protein